ncbi:hypothetical protein VPNG_05443 [Cytospora leucostoma]|uniref:Methyltransferase domain-containing protein n=1 Tax=Cytospora leucostoma TaxID=1230097 RepID=A0A423XBP3_9PEZI|nr:hypothetical protein VPNG_05443 [Cytospora leucostoma]
MAFSKLATGDFITYFHPDLTDVWDLKEIFEGTEIEDHVFLWNNLWKEGMTNWDRGGPSMALYEVICEYPELFTGRHPDLTQLKDFVGHGFGREACSGPKPGPRKKALVPACGRGYDAALLAYVFGYDVYALDISIEALVEAREYLVDLKNAFGGTSNGPPDFPFWVENRSADHGEVELVWGDFFEDVWMEQRKGLKGIKFDLIFDYTFFCAIPPTARAKWAAKMHQHLARPNGRLVCLEFPTGRHLKDGGPPHSAAFWFYQLHLANPGNEEVIKYELKKDFKHPSTGKDLKYTQKQYYTINMDAGNPYGDGLAMLARFKPRHTHEQGQIEGGKFGRDWVSFRVSRLPVDLTVKKVGEDDEAKIHVAEYTIEELDNQVIKTAGDDYQWDDIYSADAGVPSEKRKPELRRIRIKLKNPDTKRVQFADEKAAGDSRTSASASVSSDDEEPWDGRLRRGRTRYRSPPPKS